MLLIVLLHVSSWTWLLKTQSYWLLSLYIYNHTSLMDPQHFPHLYISYSSILRKFSPSFHSPKISKLSHGWCPYWLFCWEEKKNERIFSHALKSTNLYINSDNQLPLLIKCSCPRPMPLLGTKEYLLWYNLFLLCFFSSHTLSFTKNFSCSSVLVPSASKDAQI